ncbi:MAG: hypothetical protein VX663_00310 [Pseudomonadota bacterium]|nr:hypothetical protein [Pseudomonadota bacterium]
MSPAWRAAPSISPNPPAVEVMVARDQSFHIALAAGTGNEILAR